MLARGRGVGRGGCSGCGTRAGGVGLWAGHSWESGILARPATPASRGPSPRGGGSGSHSGDLDINQMLSIHVTLTLYP